MHYEQRWADLVPALFADVHVGRDPGWNVGHWSLPERRIELRGEAVWVDGILCRIVRFSGYDPELPERVTRHGERLRTAQLGAAAELFALYRRALIAAGHAVYRSRLPAWTRFDDGVEIPPLVRALYRDLADAEVERFGDPFATASRSSFRAFLGESADGSVARLWRFVHAQRLDLQRAFPSPLGADRKAFLRWARAFGSGEYGISAELMATIGVL